MVYHPQTAEITKTDTYKLTGCQVKINNFSNRKTVQIFLPISFNIYFGCSKELSHWNGSFEYPQNMFWLRNKKINFLVRSL